MKEIRICENCGETIEEYPWVILDSIINCKKCNTLRARIISADIEMQRTIKQRYKDKNFQDDLIRKQRKIMESGVNKVFTPAKPISNKALLYGRNEELADLLGNLTTDGMHSLIYGDRGVGKTSLAYVAAKTYQKAMREDNIVINIYREICGKSTTFSSLISQPLRDSGIDTSISSSQITKTKRGILSVNPVIAKAEGEIVEQEAKTYILEEKDSSHVSQQLISCRGLLIIDEAERLKQEEKEKLAEFVKHLSDRAAQLDEENNPIDFKILIVGIGNTGEEIIKIHKSTSRCLNEIHLERMNKNELAEIVDGGFQSLRTNYNLEINISKPVIDKIAELSNGYPYYTHLLAQKCAENAIKTGNMNIGFEHLQIARMEASRCATGILSRNYQEAIVDGDPIFKRILCAAAQISKADFSIEEIEKNIYTNIGKHLMLSELEGYLERLSSNDDSAIFQYKGTKYKFSDPRMSSYIRIVADDGDMKRNYI